MKSERESITTGIGELDSKFKGGGMKAGTLCVLESDPKSPSLLMLLQLFQEKTPKAHYITPLRTEKELKYSFSQMDLNPNQIDNITTGENITSFADLTGAVHNANFDDVDVLIVNGASELPVEKGQKDTMVDFYSEVHHTAIENDFIVIIHTINRREDETMTSAARHQSYIADVSLTMTQKMTENDLSQSLYINHTPPGQRITEKYEGKRVMEVSDTKGRVNVSTGGRI